MADDMFSMSFSPESMKEIAAFGGFDVILAEEFQGTMKQAGDMLTERAQAKTWQVFKSPTGQLASTISPIAPSPYEVQIGVGVPYGRRLEEGFYGTDSLNRTYNQAPEPYLQPTFDENEQEVLTMFDDAMQHVLDRITGGA